MLMRPDYDAAGFEQRAEQERPVCLRQSGAHYEGAKQDLLARRAPPGLVHDDVAPPLSTDDLLIKSP